MTAFNDHLLQQATGALNDNLFRQVFVMLVLIAAGSSGAGLNSAALLGLCFMLPFLLTAPLAGSLAERYPRHLIIRCIRGVEPLLCLLGGLAIAFGHPVLLMAVLAGFGLQSALFAPVKYAILPDLVADDELERANGRLAAATQIAILLGITLAFVADEELLSHGPFAGWSPALTVPLLGLLFCVLGLGAAWRMPAMPAINPQARLRPFAWSGLLRSLRHRPGLIAPALSSATFWALAVGIQVTMLSINTSAFGFGMKENALMTAGLGLVMSAGALLTDRLNSRAFPAALPVVGALLAAPLLLFASEAALDGRFAVYLASLYATAFCLSWWPVCMVTLLQRRSAVDRRGEVFAATSFLGNLGTALGFGLLAAIAARPPVLLGAMGWFLLAGAAVAAFRYRLQLGAWLLVILTRAAWRIRLQHGERLPEGGALLACNHQSYADALVLAAALPRPVRFIADGPYTTMPVIGWIMRLAGTIPIDGNGRNARSVRAALEAAAAAIRRGELVCIFPEGRLSGSGQIGPFRRGLERIAAQTGAPIVPLALRGLHGGVFSPSAHHRIPRPGYRVDLHIGQPLPCGTDCASARRAVASAHADLSRTADKRSQRMTLARPFLRQLRRGPRQLALADDQGSMSRLELGVAARVLLPLLGLEPDEQRVGILLPPSRGGGIVNLALAFAGRCSVNLNHTAGEHGLRQICARAGLRSLITARAYTERIGLPELGLRVVCLEDLLPRISGWAKLRAALALFCLPAGLLCRGRADDVATVVFSSGSTGSPKGVQLTHRQLLANTDAMARHYDFATDEDRILSPLPLFHSFGLSVGLWLGLGHGLAVIAQADPRDARRTGQLCKRHRATFMVSTPTFARGYLRRVEAEEFASLRFAVVGAERCPVELSERFRATFGAELYEGYGCTELGPVVSANSPDLERGGIREINNHPGTIGRPLPGVEVYAIDPESGTTLPSEREGLLIVRSPARMLGYLGEPERSAEVFVGADGYNTGDIGMVDADGFIHITGRLARFAKIGGEMVPLDNVELALNACLASDESNDQQQELAVAAVPDPDKGERLVVLHTGRLPCSPEEMLSRIDQLPPLFRPKARDFFAVEAIPQLGTGKRDLAGLKELALRVGA